MGKNYSEGKLDSLGLALVLLRKTVHWFRQLEC